LLGVWETPPYLHDGSAPTLRDVLTTNNPDDLHGYVSSLTPEQLDELVAYVQQIDNELPVRRLPFDPPAPEGGMGGSGASGGTDSGGASGASGAETGGFGGGGGTAVGGDGGSTAPAAPESDSGEGCACELAVGASSRRERRGALGALVSPLAFFGLFWVATTRRRARARNAGGSA